ncbi:CutC family-domain-containing protein [Melampsora americana]|nr:CutC family-domain-containing protein [Melampsora americana]
MRKVLIEVCVDSLESARCAIENGADRLEICGNLAIGGGVSPSIGLISVIMNRFPFTSIMVMIRSRIGSFVYIEDELQTMLSEIKEINQLLERRRSERLKKREEDEEGKIEREGLVGIVIGALSSNGQVDMKSMKRLIEVASDEMPITFHRAFDMVIDQSQAYDDILSLGGRITRILTSAGLKSYNESDSLKNLNQLITIQSNSIKKNKNQTHPMIMPGSGISPKNITQLLDILIPIWNQNQNHHNQLMIGDIHLSAGNWYVPVSNENDYVQPIARKEGMGFGLIDGSGEDEEAKSWGRWKVMKEKMTSIRRMVDQSSEGL